MSSLPPQYPTPGRLVTYRDGKEKRAVACGDLLQWKDGTPNPILDGGGNVIKYATWMGKLVTYKDGFEKYAVASECCEYPMARDDGSILDDMAFVEQANWPPYGISKHLRVHITSVAACPDLDCTHALLTYNGSGHWLGSVGGVNLDAYLVDITSGSDPPGVKRTQLQFDITGGCITPNSTGHATDASNTHTDPATGPSVFLAGTGTVFPFRGTFAPGYFAAESCCLCTASRVTFSFEGFCKRVRVGKLIGFKDGKPKYAVGGCCLPCFQSDNCCNLYGGCDLHLTIQSSLTLYVNFVPSSCSWAEEIPFPVDASVPPWNWQSAAYTPPNACGNWKFYAKCEVLDATCGNGHNQTRWTLRAENGQASICGCAAAASVDVCDCLPLELSFALNCHVTPLPGPHGCDVTWKITLHR